MPDRGSHDERKAWLVIDFTTNNALGEFDTEQEALDRIEEIRPYGRFGPDGHDLQAVRMPEMLTLEDDRA